MNKLWIYCSVVMAIVIIYSIVSILFLSGGIFSYIALGSSAIALIGFLFALKLNK